MLLQISEFIYRGKAYLQRAQCFTHTTHVCCRENLNQLASRARVIALCYMWKTTFWSDSLKYICVNYKYIYILTLM